VVQALVNHALLDELHGMLCDSVQNEKIVEMLRTALVFNIYISFEKGTVGDPQPFVPDFAIDGRNHYY
jgi:hypothetical protein